MRNSLRKVAEVSEKYGEGYVHLTSRQGVEIPFIKLDQIDEVKAALAEGDVVPGVCGPRVRTITACQGAAICPSGCIDTYALAEELDERYFGRELPHKFKFGVTGCQNNCLKAEENDVGIKGGIKVAWQEEKCIQCGVCVKACREGASHIGRWKNLLLILPNVTSVDDAPKPVQQMHMTILTDTSFLSEEFSETISIKEKQ